MLPLTFDHLISSVVFKEMFIAGSIPQFIKKIRTRTRSDFHIGTGRGCRSSSTNPDAERPQSCSRKCAASQSEAIEATASSAPGSSKRFVAFVTILIQKKRLLPARVWRQGSRARYLPAPPTSLSETFRVLLLHPISTFVQAARWPAFRQYG